MRVNNPGIWYLWTYSRNSISFVDLFFIHRLVTNDRTPAIQSQETRNLLLTRDVVEIMLCPLFLFLFRDLSFGIRKLHQIHFVFLLIVHGYQSLFYQSSLFSSQNLISIAGKEFTSHRIIFLSFFISFPVLSLVFIFGSEIY